MTHIPKNRSWLPRDYSVGSAEVLLARVAGLGGEGRLEPVIQAQGQAPSWFENLDAGAEEPRWCEREVLAVGAVEAAVEGGVEAEPV